MSLFRGIGYVFRGFGILRRNPGLVRYWAAPMVITALGLILSVVLTVAYHDDLLALLWAPPAGEGAVGFALSVVYGTLRVLSFVVELGLALLLCVMFSTVVAAPFNDALSEAVEQRETGRSAPPFSLTRVLRDALRSVRLELFKLLTYLAVMAPLFVASFVVPGVGQVLYVGLGGLFTAGYFALDYIDWPASRRGLDIKQRIALLRAHPSLMLGFGFGVWACLFVPLVNLAFMPAAVAGGTKLFLDLEREAERP